MGLIQAWIGNSFFFPDKSYGAAALLLFVFNLWLACWGLSRELRHPFMAGAYKLFCFSKNNDLENIDPSANNDSKNHDMEVLDFLGVWTVKHIWFCLEREPLELQAALSFFVLGLMPRHDV